MDQQDQNMNNVPAEDEMLDDDGGIKRGDDDESIVNDFIDETPAFVTADDAVEVAIDDDVPMDDEDGDVMDDDGNETTMMDEEDATTKVPVTDMSYSTIASHTGPVYTVGCDWDNSTKQQQQQGLMIVSGGGDDRAYLHAITAGNKTATTKSLSHPHTDSVSSVALNVNYVSTDLKKTPRLVAVGAYDGIIVLYNPDTCEQYCTQPLEGPTDIEWLCFHPKGGTVLLVGSTDGTVWMYHCILQKCMQVFVGHENSVTAGTFTSDGKWAITASSDGTVRIWAPKTGMSKHVFRFNNSHDEQHHHHQNDDIAGLTCMGMNGGTDGQLIVVGAEDGQAHICHVSTKKVVASLRHYQVPIQQQQQQQNIMQQDEEDEDEIMNLPMSVEAVGFASSTVNPNWCATGGVDGVLKIWDLGNNAQCRQICQIPSTTTNIQVDGSGVGGSGGGGGGITRLQWHQHQPLVFAAYTNGYIRIWDARNGQLLHTLTGHTDVINDMNVQQYISSSSSSENGNDDDKVIITTASDDQTVRVFHLDVQKLLQHAATAGASNDAIIATATTGSVVEDWKQITF